MAIKIPEGHHHHRLHLLLQKMTKLCRKFVQVNVKWRILKRLCFLRQFFRFFHERVLICSVGTKLHRYNRLNRTVSSPFPVPITEIGSVTGDLTTTTTMMTTTTCSSSSSSHDYESSDSDLVALKISLLGDCQIGKTSFAIKCVGGDQEKKCLKTRGLNLIDKIFSVRGARIAFSIWDVGGDYQSKDHVPVACKDAVAILFMFDLTSRSTLNNIVGWYQQARKYNQSAIPILIGTKFDDFVQLPLAMQWAIVSQARAYAQAMQATLFFSSSTHNININKIFKFITAKLFNLPWSVQRNLTIGEPIIDF